jgi:hypothetical protein
MMGRGAEDWTQDSWQPEQGRGRGGRARPDKVKKRHLGTPEPPARLQGYTTSCMGLTLGAGKVRPWDSKWAIKSSTTSHRSA